MSERKIRLLDDRTINQIAAGEVIENPASVIKELIENSLDAGASKITVETNTDLIRVVDNGMGIEEADIALAIERHATSKITKIEDLNDLASLGFRGEALASIAAVSKLSILTSPNDTGIAFFFESHGGQEHKRNLHTRQRGTTIEVRSLFYNVPVRKKFQKSDKSETSAVLKTLTNSILCYPHIGFRWLHQGKEQFNFEKDGVLLERVRALLGDEFAGSLFPVEHADAFFSLKGLSARPTYHRPNKSAQYLYINGRPVQSPFVSSKILEGYATRLPTHRFPAFILHLEVPTEWLDVNVHPQKREVRFRNEEKLGAFLIKAMENGLQVKEKPQAVTISFPKFEKEGDFSFFSLPICQEKKEPGPSFFHSIKILGKIGKYLLVEKEGDFFIVDLFKAKELLLIQSFSRKTQLAQQQLLIPLNIEFSEEEKLQVLDKIEELNEMGISIRFFGNKTFIVDALPEVLACEEVKDIVRAFLEEEKSQMSKLLRASLRKSTFSIEESKILVEKLFCQDDWKKALLQDGVILELTEREIGKKFYESN